MISYKLMSKELRALKKDQKAAVADEYYGEALRLEGAIDALTWVLQDDD